MTTDALGKVKELIAAMDAAQAAYRDGDGKVDGWLYARQAAHVAAIAYIRQLAAVRGDAQAGQHDNDCNLNMADLSRQLKGCDCDLPYRQKATPQPPAPPEGWDAHDAAILAGPSFVPQMEALAAEIGAVAAPAPSGLSAGEVADDDRPVYYAHKIERSLDDSEDEYPALHRAFLRKLADLLRRLAQSQDAGAVEPDAWEYEYAATIGLNQKAGHAALSFGKPTHNFMPGSERPLYAAATYTRPAIAVDEAMARDLQWLANDKHATDEQRAIATRTLAALTGEKQ